MQMMMQMLSSECLEKADIFKGIVNIKDRRYRLKTYKQCFIGRDAVDAMIQAGLADTRENAVQLGRMLESDLHLFQHVRGDRPFQDDYQFYRFNDFAATSQALSYNKKNNSNNNNQRRQRRFSLKLGSVMEETHSDVCSSTDDGGEMGRSQKSNYSAFSDALSRGSQWAESTEFDSHYTCPALNNAEDDFAITNFDYTLNCGSSRSISSDIETDTVVSSTTGSYDEESLNDAHDEVDKSGGGDCHIVDDGAMIYQSETSRDKRAEMSRTLSAMSNVSALSSSLCSSTQDDNIDESSSSSDDDDYRVQQHHHLTFTDEDIVETAEADDKNKEPQVPTTTMRLSKEMIEQMMANRQEDEEGTVVSNLTEFTSPAFTMPKGKTMMMTTPATDNHHQSKEKTTTTGTGTGGAVPPPTLLSEELFEQMMNNDGNDSFVSTVTDFSRPAMAKQHQQQGMMAASVQQKKNNLVGTTVKSGGGAVISKGGNNVQLSKELFEQMMMNNDGNESVVSNITDFSRPAMAKRMTTTTTRVSSFRTTDEYEEGLNDKEEEEEEEDTTTTNSTNSTIKIDEMNRMAIGGGTYQVTLASKEEVVIKFHDMGNTNRVFVQEVSREAFNLGLRFDDHVLAIGGIDVSSGTTPADAAALLQESLDNYDHATIRLRRSVVYSMTYHTKDLPIGLTVRGGTNMLFVSNADGFPPDLEQNGDRLLEIGNDNFRHRTLREAEEAIKCHARPIKLKFRRSLFPEDERIEYELDRMMTIVDKC